MKNKLLKLRNLNLKSNCIYLLILFVLFTGMKCKKDSTTFDAKDELPAITQEGKNTFGFLLNGEVWLPKGGIFTSILDLSYDPTFNGGALSIASKRILSNENQAFLSIGGININKPGTYIFEPSIKNVSFSDNKCYYTDSSRITGFITISKLDLTNKIISGTFNFKLEKNGCPTINATEGRFDMRIE